MKTKQRGRLICWLIAIAMCAFCAPFPANGHDADSLKAVLQHTHNKRTYLQILASLSDACEHSGNYEAAYRYHQMYAACKDSINNEDSSRRLQQLQFDYQLEKKQHQISLLNKERELRQSKLAKQRSVLFALFSGLLLLALISWLLYRSRQYEKRGKEVAAAQKEELSQMAVQLREMNNFKDRTFSVLSHDLRGPLATFTSTMHMLDDKLITGKEFYELKPEINKQLHALNGLLDNLLQWSNNHMKGASSVRPVAFRLMPVVAALTEQLGPMARAKNVNLKADITEDETVYADEGQVAILLRNLLNNAIKFTPPGGSVIVSAGADAGNAVITVADTGVGIAKEKLAKLFTHTAGSYTYGTEGEKGIGLGLLLCYEFVQANKGNIAVASQQGHGTTFTVRLPSTGPVNK